MCCSKSSAFSLSKLDIEEFKWGALLFHGRTAQPIGEPGLDGPEQLDAKDVIQCGRWECALNSRNAS